MCVCVCVCVCVSVYLCVFIFTKYMNTISIYIIYVVEGDPRVGFSIATTPKCKERRYSFPWIAPLDT